MHMQHMRDATTEFHRSLFIRTLLILRGETRNDFYDVSILVFDVLFLLGGIQYMEALGCCFFKRSIDRNFLVTK